METDKIQFGKKDSSSSMKKQNRKQNENSLHKQYSPSQKSAQIKSFKELAQPKKVRAESKLKYNHEDSIKNRSAADKNKYSQKPPLLSLRYQQTKEKGLKKPETLSSLSFSDKVYSLLENESNQKKKEHFIKINNCISGYNSPASISKKQSQNRGRSLNNYTFNNNNNRAFSRNLESIKNSFLSYQDEQVKITNNIQNIFPVKTSNLKNYLSQQQYDNQPQSLTIIDNNLSRAKFHTIRYVSLDIQANPPNTLNKNTSMFTRFRDYNGNSKFKTPLKKNCYSTTRGDYYSPATSSTSLKLSRNQNLPSTPHGVRYYYSSYFSNPSVQSLKSTQFDQFSKPAINNNLNSSLQTSLTTLEIPIQSIFQSKNNSFWVTDKQFSRDFKLQSDSLPSSSLPFNEPISSQQVCKEQRIILYDQIIPTIKPFFKRFRLPIHNCNKYKGRRDSLNSQSTSINIKIQKQYPHSESLDNLIEENIKVKDRNMYWLDKQQQTGSINLLQQPQYQIDQIILQESNIISESAQNHEQFINTESSDISEDLFSQQIMDNLQNKDYKFDGILKVSSSRLIKEEHQNENNKQNLSRIYNYNFLDKSLDNSGMLGLDHFQIGKCLGRGTFGNVYLAKHKLSHLLVAIKQINTKHLRNPQIEWRIQQEIKIQSFCDHPNVLKIFGFFIQNSMIHIILELSSHGDIYKEIKREKLKRFTEKKTAGYIRQICESLLYLHNQDIIHRDIKPENILNCYGILKLSDFGWSIFSKEKRQTFCGTLDYLSPEIISGKQYDCKVDIWSIGVLTYELLTGKPPFGSTEDQSKTQENIRNGNYQCPSYVSEQARQFIQYLLVSDPNQRMSLEQALNHQWILRNTDNLLLSIDDSISQSTLNLLS